jgi:hypothetical protein
MPWLIQSRFGYDTGQISGFLEMPNFLVREHMLPFLTRANRRCRRGSDSVTRMARITLATFDLV